MTVLSVWFQQGLDIRHISFILFSFSLKNLKRFNSHNINFCFFSVFSLCLSFVFLVRPLFSRWAILRLGWTVNNVVVVGFQVFKLHQHRNCSERQEPQRTRHIFLHHSECLCPFCYNWNKIFYHNCFPY